MKVLTQKRRGAASNLVTFIFFLFIVTSIVFMTISTSMNQNIIIRKELQIDYERAKEGILLTELGTSINNEFITFVRVMNTGEVPAVIKSIYTHDGNETTFLVDPSTYMDTGIEVNTELVITGPNGNYLTSFNPNVKIEVVTERGTKSIEYEGIVKHGPLSLNQKTASSIEYGAPVQLNSLSMRYMKINSDGTLIVNEMWHPGWNVISDIGYLAWNISIMNIDDQNIVLGEYACLTIVPNESPPSQSLTWYIDLPNKIDKRQLLISRQNAHLVFKWSTASGSLAQQLHNISPVRYLVFITLYGYYENEDGTKTTYSQTIPVDAALIVR